MALSKKLAFLQEKLRPDIAVIPECSRDSVLACQDQGLAGFWWGENKHKGLGVIAVRPWSLELGGKHSQKWIVPVRVNGPVCFLLVAVWACRVGTVKEMNYSGQTYDAISGHPEWFGGSQSTVVCGDFNSNAIWDRERKIRNHSAVVKLLSDKKLFSAYHSQFSEPQGLETQFTHFLRYEKKSCFHIDYVFLPEAWRTRVQRVDVGSYEDWRTTSDHVPVIVEISQASITS